MTFEANFALKCFLNIFRAQRQSVCHCHGWFI